MKKILTLVVMVATTLVSIHLNAQNCGGNPGNNICTASSNLHAEGFSPLADSLACIVTGQAYAQVIQIHTPTNYKQGSTTYTIKNIKIDSISNLPCGLCWAMDANSNFTINGNATGCFKISGTTYDAPGQYQLRIIADVTPTGLFAQTLNNQNLADYGLKYFVRVELPGDTCIRLDTLATGNTASQSGNITHPVITGNTTICATGGSTTLKVTGNGYYAYAWSNGTFGDSITVTATGTYTVTVYGNCNRDSATTAVTISAVRDTITAAGPTTFCQGGSVTLSVPAGSTYSWSTGATTNSISTGIAGNYMVTVTNSLGCSAVSSGLNVTINPLPADTISANGPLSFCPGGSVILTGPNGLTYRWNNGSTAQSITTAQSGSYTLIVTNNNNCTAISAQVTVVESALPDNTVTASGATTFCTGDSIVLSGAAGLVYHWSTGATVQTIAVSHIGSYTLTVTNSNNCSAASSATNIALYALPNDTIIASGPLALCTGGNVVLSAAQGLAYNWSTGSNAQSIITSQGGTYYVTVTNGNNCSAVSAPVIVTVNVTPNDTVTASGPTTFCSGTSVTLSAIAGYSYHWSTGATSQNINVAQAGNYTVTISTGNSCSATSVPVTITVNTNPNNTVTVGGATGFCAGGSVTLTAVAGLTYQWSNNATTQTITATQTGNYTVTVTNANSCTAVSTPVNVTVLAPPSATVTANGPTTFCAGGSVTLTATAGFIYVWSNSATTQSITVTQAGNYTVTVTNGNHCSAAVSAPVVSLNSPTAISIQPVNQVTCINGQVTFSVTASGDNITYQWQKNGVNINGQQNSAYNIPSAALADTGNYRVIITGVCGTDTSNIATLSVAGSLTFSQQPISQTACLGSTVSFTVVANGGNTSYQWKKNNQNIANANSATFTINSIATTDTGGYTCFVTSSCGNATSNAATLTINFPTSSTINQTICAGKTYNFNGHILSSSGTYRDTLLNAHTCDSVITLSLTVTAPLIHTYSDSICAGTLYNFNGQLLTSAGTYQDTVLTLSGCDSIVTLHLLLKQTTSSNTYASICQGATYHFNGMAFTSSDTYQDTLTGANHCDSIAYLHLTVNQPTYSSINASICGNRTYNFNGHAISSAGIYTDTINNVHGCDSIITLNLTHTSSVTFAYNAVICTGQYYSFNGRTITSAGVYIDTLQASGGCDSIVTLHLIVNQPSGSSVSASVCAGGTYTFGGRTLNTTGTYYDTLNNVHGCDSIITLNLTVNPAIRTSIHAAICSGRTYQFNGQQLNTSGTYTAHYTAQNGCDSLVTLVLQVGAFVTNNITASVCAGSLYNFNGHSLSQAGNYNDTLTAQGGCDSIIILTLSVIQPTTATIHATICSGSTYGFNGRQLTTAGNYNDTLTGANGCDSIVTLVLQLNSFVSTVIFDTLCQGSSYAFNGQNLAVTGVYYDTLTARGGCDSIITLNLTVNQTTSSTTNAAICVGSTYLFNGIQIGATGTYFKALTGSNGCDSIVTLQLIVNSFITTSVNAHICAGSSYVFYGRILHTTGNYVDTLSAQGGCDSIIMLNLTVNPIISHINNVSICTGSSYNFYGRQLTAPGIYRDTLITSGGCDSEIVLHLDTSSILTGTANGNICTGSTYNFNGQQLTAPGTYNDTLTASGGCDSIVTLTLNLAPSYNFVFNQSVCGGDSFSFNGHSITVEGSYTDTLNSQLGCDSILTLNLTVKGLSVITWPQPDTICNYNDSNEVTLLAPAPTGGVLTGPGLNGLVLTVNGSAAYPVTYLYTDSNGCSNTLTKNIVINSCLGIEPVIAKYQIAIYPNPVNEVVIAQADVFANGHVVAMVYDIMGQCLTVPFIHQADKITFNTANLTAGMYLIKLNINGILLSRHFIKAD